MRIILRQIMHRATWTGTVYKTDCGITVAVISKFDTLATYCMECFPV